MEKKHTLLNKVDSVVNTAEQSTFPEEEWATVRDIIVCSG